MDKETSHDWLRRVPRTAAGLTAWLDAGRPHYPDAGTMGNAIKDASRDAWRFDFDLAEWLGRGLILFGETEGDESLIGLGEIALGDAIRMKGDYAVGLGILDQAAARFERIGDDVGWARTRIGWLGHVFFLEQYPDVEPIVQRAMAIFEQNGAVGYLIPLFQNYANYCIAVGRLADALPLCEQAKKIAEAIESADARYSPLLSIITLLVQSHSEVGNYQEAESYVQTGMALVESHTVLDNTAIEFLSTTSNLYLRTGRYTQSLYYIEKARQSVSWGDTATILEYRAAQAYLYLNRLSESEVRLTTLLAALENQPSNTLLRAVFSYLLAEVYRLAGRTDEAVPLSAQALELMLNRSNPSLAWLNVIYRQYAFLLKQSGDSSAAEAAIGKALAFADQVGEHIEQINTRLVATSIYSDTALAWQLLSEADAMAQGLSWLRWRVKQTIARLTDQPQTRRQALIEATEELDSVQSSLAASFHADYLVEAQKLYEALITEYVTGGDLECAWQTIERSKSRALLNTLMAQQEAISTVDSPLITELKRLQLKHYELTKQLAAGKLAQESAGPLLREIESGISKTQEGIEVEQLGRREPLGVPPPFIPVAPPESDLVGYYVMEEVVHLFLHNGERYFHHTAPISVRDLYDILLALNTNMVSVALAPDVWVAPLLRQLQSHLATLYQHLILPLKPHLRHEKLVIVPHGVLHQLPFHLLWDGARYLMENHEIRLLPTARLLERVDSGIQPAVHHAVISHDWDGRLPNAEHEGRRVAALLGLDDPIHGDDAKKETVLTLMDSRGVLHIAAHGAHRPDHPELSHIQLSDGQLTLVDLFRCPIHKDLVTLSACETGMAVIRAGDDPVGLWRGFLAAGARSLLVALWQLEDTTSRQLMEQYYHNLAAGMTRVCALRDIQCRWLANAHGRYVHPFYWGAYQLIGDDGPIAIRPFTE